MSLEIYLESIKQDFKNELKKREKLLDKYDETLRNLRTVEHTLNVLRRNYPMKNEICELCMFNDECTDAGRVEGRNQICSGFLAKK